MKNDKVDSATKVAPRPTPPVAETDSPVGKMKTARVVSCEKSTKQASMEAAEICALLKPNLLEDINACAKFIDDVRGKFAQVSLRNIRLSIGILPYLP